MDYRIGKMSELEVRFRALMDNHAEEVGILGRAKFLPQLKTYRDLESAGMLRIFLAYEEGAPAGYQIFLLTHHPHYSGVVWAQADAVYVAPDHRGVGAVRFICWADERLEAEGVEVIQRGASTANTYGRLLHWLEYEAGEVQYFKKVR